MAAPKKNAKATRKFEAKHLKGVLEKRKTSAKIKQRTQIQAKKQAKRAQDAEFYKGAAGDKAAAGPARGPKRPDATVSDMSVDAFFQGGFQILDGKDGKDSKTNGKANGKGKAAKAAASLGKRKRNGAGGGDDDDDASGDESEESMEYDPVGSDSDDLDDDNVGIGMSKAAMDELAEKDPEFYQFLKENDPGALDFDENAGDLAEVDALSDGASDAEGAGAAQQRPRKKQKKAKATDSDDDDDDDNDGEDEDPFGAADNELQLDTVARWERSMAETQSLRAARQIVLAFRSAAHLNEVDEDGRGAAAAATVARRYAIKSPEVFHQVVVVALRHVPLVLQHHVPVRTSAAQRLYVPTESRKFKALSGLVRSFAASVLHLLGTLSDDGTLRLTLAALTPLVPYLLSFRKLLKHVVKTVVHFWAQPASSETTRVTAFLVLRQLVVGGDRGVREATLKAAYQGLVQGSRATNANTAAGVHLMKNSAAALWGVDAAVGYTTAFAAIRQLAIHLRNSIVHNQNNAFRAVYNWQYVHSLDFWSRVLAEHCNVQAVAAAEAKVKALAGKTKTAATGKKGKAAAVVAEAADPADIAAAEAEAEALAATSKQLSLLVYPLVQVTLGAVRLIPTAAYFPLRFQLVRSLLRVSRATGTYIPLAPVLLEVLASAEMKRKTSATAAKAKKAQAKNSHSAAAVKQLDFAVAYKAPQSLLGTAVYQTGVGEQVVELLSEFFALWATNIAFPELALPVVIALKRWLKEARRLGGGGAAHGKSGKGGANSKVVAGLALLVQKLEANARFVEEKRARVEFAPRDRSQVDAFLRDFDWQKTPVGAFVVAQRAVNAEKQRALEAARLEEDRKRQDEKKERQAARLAEAQGVEMEDEEEEEEGEDDDEDEEEEEDEEDEEEEEDDEEEEVDDDDED